MHDMLYPPRSYHPHPRRVDCCVAPGERDSLLFGVPNSTLRRRWYAFVSSDVGRFGRRALLYSASPRSKPPPSAGQSVRPSTAQEVVASQGIAYCTYVSGRTGIRHWDQPLEETTIERSTHSFDICAGVLDNDGVVPSLTLDI